ncbi:hypothetical protein JXQ70_11655 [bacterium]|nr:hypothetical protein [bacterium]
MPAQLKLRLKAVIMSAFLVPGAGQYYLGRKLCGLILMILSMIVVIIIFFSIYDSIQTMVRQDFLDGRIDLSLTGMLHYAFQKTTIVTPAIGKRIWLWLLLFVAIWIYGICDACSSRGLRL